MARSSLLSPRCDTGHTGATCENPSEGDCASADCTCKRLSPAKARRPIGVEGRLRMTRFPYTFSETPADVRRLQPRLGEHNAEVLREAGLTPAEIDALLASGATLQG